MAKPTTLRWTKLTLWPEVSAGVYESKECGLNAKGFSISGDMAEVNVPDCDDPDAATWVERTIRALSAGVSGSGLMAEESFAFWRDWALSAAPKNLRIVLDLAASDGFFEGLFLLNQFELSGNEADGKVGVTLGLSSDGPVAWVVGAPTIPLATEGEAEGEPSAKAKAPPTKAAA